MLSYSNPVKNIPMTKPTARVAVITRTKDRPLLLERAILSVTKQTYTDWLMVIVNDGGDKKPVDALVKKYEKALKGRVHVIHHPKSVGMEAASNAGIKASNSEYVIIHDDDDAWHPEFLIRTAGYLDEHAKDKKLAGVITYIERVWETIKGKTVRETRREDCSDWVKELTLWAMCGGNFFPPISFLYRRDAYKKIGGMYNEELPVLGDWEFNLRFMEQFDIGLIPEILAYYHHREADTGGDYANTVVDGIARHKVYNERIRNEYLRKELVAQKWGTGLLMNIAHHTNHQLVEQQQRHEQEQHVAILEANYAALQKYVEKIDPRLDHLEKENDHLNQENRSLEKQLEAIKCSSSWRITAPMRGIKHLTRRWRIFFQPRYYRKAWHILLHEGPGGVLRRLKAYCSRQSTSMGDYDKWVEEFDTLSDADRSAIRRHIEQFKKTPLISVVMPVYNVGEKWLRQVIESVRNQLYTNWELCIADDKSPSPHIAKVLEEYAQKDKRIKYVIRKENGHISAASNSALKLAKGEFVALLDHDDLLAEHALYHVAHVINTHPNVDMIYSDEDKVDQEGRRYGPYFKSDWNPDLFYGQNMFSHLGVYRRTLLEKVGGFREGYEGSQDYDLALRVLKLSSHDNVHHIPHILYHWRSLPTSTATSIEVKSYAVDASRKSLEDYFGKNVTVMRANTQTPYHRIRYPLPKTPPKVSILIPTRDREPLLRRCVDSILAKTSYPNYELVIINNQSKEKSAINYLRSLASHPNITVIDYDAPFNYSDMNNKAAAQCDGDVLAFVNNDVEVISGDWLEELVSYILQPDIGVAGAKLYYPDDTIQHAGVLIGGGTQMVPIACHLSHGLLREDIGYGSRAALAQSVSAVTGACMVMQRKVFEKLGGFDAEHLAASYNDVDLCLRAREHGYRVVMTPFAELYHHESASRGFVEGSRDKMRQLRDEIQYMQQRWGDTLKSDPYYNPNLDYLTGDFALAFPPRLNKPWQSDA